MGVGVLSHSMFFCVMAICLGCFEGDKPIRGTGVRTVLGPVREADAPSSDG